VTNLDTAMRAARANGATIVVAPFADPVGRDAIIRWPGGVMMQLYWHTTPPSAPSLVAEPENRVYLSSDEADAFIKAFAGFAHATVVSDDPRAPGLEIGRPGDTYRRVRLASGFGPVMVLVTDGHLPYPYGREVTGYSVPDLTVTLARATAAGVTVLVPPYTAGTRRAAIVQFPGGYIAEIHSEGGR
jgi:predicted enzyme related to lactoylglutathione lyase